MFSLTLGIVHSYCCSLSECVLGFAAFDPTDCSMPLQGGRWGVFTTVRAPLPRVLTGMGGCVLSIDAVWENVRQFWGGLLPAAPTPRTRLSRPRADGQAIGLKEGSGLQVMGVVLGSWEESPLMSYSLGQTHGSLLRLHQVSPVDSGEYVCRVEGGSMPLESSVLVTIEPADTGK